MIGDSLKSNLAMPIIISLSGAALIYMMAQPRIAMKASPNPTVERQQEYGV